MAINFSLIPCMQFVLFYLCYTILGLAKFQKGSVVILGFSLWYNVSIYTSRGGKNLEGYICCILVPMTGFFTLLQVWRGCWWNWRAGRYTQVPGRSPHNNDFFCLSNLPTAIRLHALPSIPPTKTSLVLLWRVRGRVRLLSSVLHFCFANSARGMWSQVLY